MAHLLPETRPPGKPIARNSLMSGMIDLRPHRGGLAVLGRRRRLSLLAWPGGGGGCDQLRDGTGPGWANSLLSGDCRRARRNLGREASKLVRDAGKFFRGGPNLG